MCSQCRYSSVLANDTTIFNKEIEAERNLLVPDRLCIRCFCDWMVNNYASVRMISIPEFFAVVKRYVTRLYCLVSNTE